MTKKRITAKTMKNLGFTEKWPAGNPKECWWETPKNIDVGGVWFTGLDTQEQFWKKIAEAFRRQGQEQAKEPLRKAIKELLR